MILYVVFQFLHDYLCLTQYNYHGELTRHFSGTTIRVFCPEVSCWRSCTASEIILRPFSLPLIRERRFYKASNAHHTQQRSCSSGEMSPGLDCNGWNNSPTFIVNIWMSRNSTDTAVQSVLPVKCLRLDVNIVLPRLG
jgi:hypothetical protein